MDTRLTSREAAAYLGVTEDTVRKWRSKKCGPPYYRQTMPKRIYYLLSDLAELRDDVRVEA